MSEVKAALHGTGKSEMVLPLTKIYFYYFYVVFNTCLIASKYVYQIE